MELFLSASLLLGLGAASANTGATSIDVILQRFLGQPFAPVSANISAPCRAHSEFYLQELKSYKQWALKMYDASAKLQSGLMTGNMFNYGNFDQCMLVKPDTEAGFAGQHCTVDIRLSLGENCTWCGLVKDQKKFLQKILGEDAYQVLFNYAMAWGFCVPSSCSAEDARRTAAERLAPLAALGLVHVQVVAKPRMCRSALAAAPGFSGPDYGFLALMIVLVTLLICGSFFDILTRKLKYDTSQDNTATSVLKSFSIFMNGHEMITAKTNKNHVGCLNGIRFISAVWVILGHKLVGLMLTNTENWTVFLENRFSYMRMFLHNAFVATDTFLLVSGFVLSYTVLRYLDKTSTLNIPIFYLERYLRLTPVYAVIIFFHATVMVHMGSGPRWFHAMQTERENCLKYWWSNLLYVNNYVGQSKNMCLETGWYLAVDMQLYVASPLLLYPLWRRPRAGLALLAALLAASVTVPAAITATYRQPGLPSFNLFKGTDFVLKTGRYYDHFNLLYTPAYARMGPYVLGLGLGYLMHLFRNKEIILSKLTVLAGWTASAALMLTIIFGCRGMYLDITEYDVVEASVFGGCHRTVWALAVAWVIFACEKGYGGPVNSLLSSDGMAIMNQFTFNIYLCHWTYLLFVLATEQVPYYYSNFNNVRVYVGDSLMVILIAIVITLTIEMPIRNVCKILINKGLRHKKQQGNTDVANKVPPPITKGVGANHTNYGEEVEMSTEANGNSAHVEEPKQNKNPSLQPARFNVHHSTATLHEILQKRILDNMEVR
ncbi:nose resistant to fluoxetine protein 6-like [Bacillus rossius redtenbacheri]|uniref:nose resistant to fluoxetine protein 6-like n=1 Tax=Bacillus rossius redtenbacheri TaxID=93214 RepID=UPI002FDD1198